VVVLKDQRRDSRKPSNNPAPAAIITDFSGFCLM
jgi:hypothetical protein